MGLKSIGKAGKAVTKQLGRSLTSMGESPSQTEGPAKHRESSERRPTGRKFSVSVRCHTDAYRTFFSRRRRRRKTVQR